MPGKDYTHFWTNLVNTTKLHQMIILSHTPSTIVTVCALLEIEVFCGDIVWITFSIDWTLNNLRWARDTQFQSFHTWTRKNNMISGMCGRILDWLENQTKKCSIDWRIWQIRDIFCAHIVPQVTCGRLTNMTDIKTGSMWTHVYKLCAEACLIIREFNIIEITLLIGEPDRCAHKIKQIICADAWRIW